MNSTSVSESLDPLESKESEVPIQQKLETLPDLPGVYLFKGRQSDILYIGKSKSLRKRVRSYFQPSANHNLRIAVMVSLAVDVSLIVTDTETEALILEEQLIKTHLPRYNVALKDDKSYPYCKLTINELYPRLFLVREKHEQQAEYFGPYTSVRDARYVLELVDRYFPLRKSKMELDGRKTYRPCLNFQLKRCLGPCQGTLSVETYQETVKQVRLFLQGRDRELIRLLEQQMHHASECLAFEKAAEKRDQIRAIQHIFEKQKVLTPDEHDQDVFNVYRESDSAGVQVLFIRNGRLLGTDFFFFEKTEKVSDDNLLGHVLNRIYMSESAVVPQEVLLPFPYSDQDVFCETLTQKINRKVSVLVPQKGHKKALISMAHRNAQVNLADKRNRTLDDSQVLQQVQQKLHLKRLPQTVEAFDISHLSGTNTVASLICWKNNQPYKEGYRKYKIQHDAGSDDFASMHEVLTRRYVRSLSGEFPLPDLILVDGGKGQLNTALQVFEEIGISLDKVDVVGFAKGRSEKRLKHTRPDHEDYEYVLKPKQKNEIRLDRNSAVLYFLKNIRDESHRFAVTFQRTLKRKEDLHSILDDIPGVGPKRKRALLQYFGSLKRLKGSNPEEIEKVEGISQPLAHTIYESLNSDLENHPVMGEPPKQTGAT
ncbi:excinuclease ABC subunit UvrC [Deltaproteobacteria bacterium TL4]